MPTVLSQTSVQSTTPLLIVTLASLSVQKDSIAPVDREVVTHNLYLAKKVTSAQEQEPSSSARQGTTKMQLDSPLASSAVPRLRPRDTIVMAVIRVEKVFFVRLDAIARLAPSILMIIRAQKASTILILAHVI